MHWMKRRMQRIDRKTFRICSLALLLSVSVAGTALAAKVPATGIEDTVEEAASGDGPASDGLEGSGIETVGSGSSGAEAAGSENGGTGGQTDVSVLGRRLTEEEKLALEDSVLEYNEIADRVELYNKDYKNTKTTIYSSVLSMNAADDLAEEASLLMEDALDLKDDDMDAETRALFEGYKEAARALRKQAQQLTNDELPGTYERTLRQVKYQLTQAVQNLVFQYHTLSSKTDLAVKNAELSREMFQAKQTMFATGQISEDALLEAKQSVLEAESSAQEAQLGLEVVKTAIKRLLGWDNEDQIEIAALPVPDFSADDTLDLEADQKAAVGANSSLMSIRTTSASGSADRSVKKRNVKATEQSIKIQMEQLYASRMAERKRYEAAISEKEAADLTMQAAESKNALGMMGRLDYLGAELAWLNAKADYIDAAVSYYRAAETYHWAVKGLIAPDAG